ncbi:MAG: FAD-dependent oxidoreductase [Bacteriovorax sp.]|nr:FAD-dependent oxidoreductase [Rhizobacter sp.]
MAAQRIGIAGAGLLGRLLAWRLSGLGHTVTVFDPATGPLDRGQTAGWTAAGMLSPWAELESADGHVAELGLRSLALWAQTVNELPQSPEPVFFRRDGSLLLAHRSDLGTAQRLIGVLQGKMPAGQAPRVLSADQLRELEPSVHGPTHAWLLEGEGQIHTVQAMQALAEAATQRGVRWCWGATTRDLTPGRIDGQGFDAVFDVRGVGARPELPVRGEGQGFTPQVRGEGQGFTPQVRGVRGEILWLHAPGVELRRPLRLLHPRWRVYLVPRPGDIVVVGASEIESEDRSPISVRTLLGLLSAAHSVVPELAEARVVHTETNLRPALPDNLPHTEIQPGLTRINGLFRHGWLIAPALVEDALRNMGLGAASVRALREENAR